MSSIVHPKLVHCFNHTTDPGVRMMIGNLVCGLYDSHLFVLDDNLWSVNGHVSISESSPEDLTDFITTAVHCTDSRDRQDHHGRKVGRKTVTRAVRSYVLGLGLPLTRAMNVINTLNMAVPFKKITLNDVVFNDRARVVGIKGVTVDDLGTVTLATHPYK